MMEEKYLTVEFLYQYADALNEFVGSNKSYEEVALMNYQNAIKMKEQDPDSMTDYIIERLRNVLEQVRLMNKGAC